MTIDSLNSLYKEYLQMGWRRSFLYFWHIRQFSCIVAIVFSITLSLRSFFQYNPICLTELFMDLHHWSFYCLELHNTLKILLFTAFPNIVTIFVRIYGICFFIALFRIKKNYFWWHCCQCLPIFAEIFMHISEVCTLLSPEIPLCFFQQMFPY